MNRRKFIQQTSIATTGFLSLPSLLKAAKKEGIVLGHNNKRYRINTAWSQLDVAKYPVKDCHEMVQDSKGRIILLTNEVIHGAMNIPVHMDLLYLMKTVMRYCSSAITTAIRSSKPQWMEKC